jgi:hypothetical protein
VTRLSDRISSATRFTSQLSVSATFGVRLVKRTPVGLLWTTIETKL